MPKILAGPINILLLSEKIRNMSRRGHNVELKINFIWFEPNPNVLPEGHLLKIPFNLRFSDRTIIHERYLGGFWSFFSLR